MEPLARVYSKARCATNELFGSIEGGLYGELTQDAMDRVLHAIDGHCGLQGAKFLDVGSGLGLPTLHAACMGSKAAGVEICDIRHNLALVALARVGADLSGGSARFWHGPAETMEWDADIVYSFDVGMSTATRAKLAKRFNASPAVVLCTVMDWPGAEARRVDSVRGSMRGSGEGKTLQIRTRPRPGRFCPAASMHEPADHNAVLAEIQNWLHADRPRRAANHRLHQRPATCVLPHWPPVGAGEGAAWTPPSADMWFKLLPPTLPVWRPPNVAACTPARPKQGVAPRAISPACLSLDP